LVLSQSLGFPLKIEQEFFVFCFAYAVFLFLVLFG